MQFHSPITHVSPLTHVRRRRLLSRPGEVVAIVGQEVSPIQVVARARMPAAVYVLRASEVLGVEPEEVEQYLLVSKGANVQRGTPLMQRPSRFGRTKLFRSPADGVLRQIRHGYLVLQQGGTVKEIRAMMEARVAAVIPSRGVILETIGTLIQAIWDSGNEGFGMLKMAANAPEYVLEADRIGAGARNAILVTGNVTQPEVLSRLEEIGARGLITGGMPAELCAMAREVSYPIVITDGIGVLSMAEPIFELLHQSEGRQASILASGQGTRGQRTEIVIPLPVGDVGDRNYRLKDTLEIGSLVRILRAGKLATVGEVTHLYPAAKRLSGNVRVPGANVKLASGEQIYVPYPNLDLIIH